ncbi:MAG: hypothetical protein FJ303_07950 [Planctomycetes bacterium]|nr:hypothetical protein [Planctomycetota bacterium]
MAVALAALALCMMLAAPYREPIGGDTPPAVEAEWYRQLRSGGLTIPLKNGRISITVKKVVVRTLISPAIMMHDAERGQRWDGSAAEAELRFDPATRIVFVHVRQWTAISLSNDASIFLESAVFSLKLPDAR